MDFTDVELYKVSESVRAYAYLILSSQASARSGIVGNTASALTAQSAFLNNFENIVNRRVDIREDIKRYQDNLTYASSKVDYSVGENIYMLPSDMSLKIKTFPPFFCCPCCGHTVIFLLHKLSKTSK